MMCREIKFRAWDRKNVRMEYSGSRPSFGFWKWVDYDSSTPLMQYTGLKDKNGAEIFEGDIVRVGDKHQVTSVTFENGCYYTIVGTSKYRLGGWKEHAEVIGNIYSNPELLEAT